MAFASHIQVEPGTDRYAGRWIVTAHGVLIPSADYATEALAQAAAKVIRRNVRTLAKSDAEADRFCKTFRVSNRAMRPGDCLARS
jgi:hypothetical protein